MGREDLGALVNGEHWTKRLPERLARGERHGRYTHPEATARGERSGAVTHPERVPRGEQHGCAKLHESDVIEIRQAYTHRYSTQHELADLFGVTQALIGYIVRRQIWKHVP